MRDDLRDAIRGAFRDAEANYGTAQGAHEVLIDAIANIYENLAALAEAHNKLLEDHNKLVAVHNRAARKSLEAEE